MMNTVGPQKSRNHDSANRSFTKSNDGYRLIEIFPSLIINRCPTGCNDSCVRVRIYETLGHSIICECLCGHNKKEPVLEMVGGNRDSNTTSTNLHPRRQVQNEDW